MICNISRYFQISYRHISSAFEMTCFLISSSGQLRPWIRSLLCHWHFLRSHVRIFISLPVQLYICSFFSLFISSVSTLYFHFKFIFVPFFALYFFCVNFIFLFQLYIFPVSIMFLLVLLNNPLVAALYFQLSISSVSFLYFFRFNFVFIPFKLYISFIST